MAFGKKPAKVISPERLSAALRTVPLAEQPKLTRRTPRPDRQSTWAHCVLVWEPAGREEGICIDISESGARIRFRRKIAMPAQVHFISAKLGINAPAEFVRQDGYDVAIRFVV